MWSFSLLKKKVINKEKGKAGRSPVVLGREVDMQGEREKGMDRYEN